MYTRLHVTATEADMFHMFDVHINREYKHSWTLMAFVFLSIFVYAPLALVCYIGCMLQSDALWIYLLIVIGFGMFWHIACLTYTKHNAYLYKYIRKFDQRHEWMEVLSDEYFPIRLFLYNQKYSFVRGYTEDGNLVLEFSEGGTPHTISGFEFKRVRTADTAKHGLIVLDMEGVTVYGGESDE